MSDREFIVSAAIEHNELIYSVPAPGRHHNIVYLMSRAGLDSSKTTNQGFLTSRGKFVSRNVGLELAVRADQIKTKHEPKHELFTEDMW